MAKKRTSTRPKPSKGKRLFYLILLCCSLFAFKTTTIFIFIGMLPSIVAYYGDTSRKRLYFRSLSACNLAGVIPYAGEMMARGNTFSGFVDISTQLMTWFVIFGSAMMGTILMEFCPMLARHFIDVTQHKRITTLENKQKRIIEEWGEEIQYTTK